MVAMSQPTPGPASTYRLDRRFVLTSVGAQIIGAGVAAMLAFLVWDWFWLLFVVLLANAARVLVLPPTVVRADDRGVRLGGPVTSRPVEVEWSDVDDVALERGRLVFTRTDGSSVVFSLVHIARRADDFVREVYDRLNAANGYSRFDPDA